MKLLRSQDAYRSELTAQIQAKTSADAEIAAREQQEAEQREGFNQAKEAAIIARAKEELLAKHQVWLRIELFDSCGKLCFPGSRRYKFGTIMYCPPTI